MNNCATCGMSISRGGLCTACWKQWTFTGTYPVKSIIWLQELVRIQRKFEGNSNPVRELCFSDADINDETWY